MMSLVYLVWSATELYRFVLIDRSFVDSLNFLDGTRRDNFGKIAGLSTCRYGALMDLQKWVFVVMPFDFWSK